MGINISEKINTNTVIDSDLIGRWNGVIEILSDKHVVKTIDISPVLAEKYKFDLYGLFSNEISIPNEHIYPHIRVNGYDCSNSYDGKKLQLKILDSNIVTNYYKLFTK